MNYCQCDCVSANVDLAHTAVGVSQADGDRQNVSAEVTAGKLAELEEEDIENGFIRVTQDLPVPKTGDANAKEVATVSTRLIFYGILELLHDLHIDACCLMI